MNKKVLWFIVIDSALILCALMYFLRSEPVSDQTIKPMQEVSNVVQVDEPKSTIQTNKVDDSSSEVPQITDSEKQASSEHEHHQSTARLIIPERDELGLSTHAMMQSGKDGYPNITSTDFSFMKASQLPVKGAEVKVVFADRIELTGSVLSSSVQESISSLGVRFVTPSGEKMIMQLMFDGHGDLNRGFILSSVDKYSYTIVPAAVGQVLLQAVERESILPDEEGFLPPVNALQLGSSESNPSAADAVLSGLSSGPAAAPPILESRPGATGVIFLDFDGHTTTHSMWTMYNGEAPIVSAAVTLSATQITEIWQRVSESFSPFTINVTTSLDVFRAAGDANKIRIVLSPTSWWPSAGGVAYVGSWQWYKGAANLDDDVPGFVFTAALGNSLKNIADATVHEVGHTLGLNHDGRVSPSEGYYYGQGVWAPNMGAGYNKPIVQWSKGEYSSANNTEDDLAIMDTYGGVNVIADSVGNTLLTASALSFSGQQAQHISLIESKDDLDMFAFTTTAGTTTILAESSWVGDHGVLNLRLQLYDSAGALLATASPASSGSAANIDASLGSMTLTAGTYYVAVDGPAEGAANVSGFSTYGNIGSYKLTVTVPLVSGTATPTATSTNTLIPATATSTSTYTPIVPTSTPTRTNTPISPTATPTLTNTPLNTPTLQATFTNTPSNTATLTPIPTATATQTVATPNRPEPTPTVTSTNTPESCTGGNCATNKAPVANPDRISLRRDGTANFSFKVEDPDQLPVGGIAHITISKDARFGSVAPVLQDDSSSRNGVDSVWSYSVSESPEEDFAPLQYHPDSRTLTRTGGSPSVSNPAVISRKFVNLSAGAILVAEMKAAQTGTMFIIPVVTISRGSLTSPADSEGVGFVVYVNGEAVSERVELDNSNTSNFGVGTVSALVTKDDVIEVFIDRIGAGSRLQLQLFHAMTTAQWRYESAGKKAKADFFDYYASDGQNDSNSARIQIVPSGTASIVRKRKTADEVLMGRVRDTLIQKLKSF